MSGIVFFIALLVAGCVIAYLLVKARLEGKAIALQSQLEGLKQHLSEKDAELSRARSELMAEKEARVSADVRYQEAEKNLAEQKTLLEAMKTELSDTFNALSSAALKSTSEDFLRLAGEHLGKVIADTKGRLGEHKEAMEGLVRPLESALKSYNEQISSIELKRKQDYTSLDEQIKMLHTVNLGLQKETGNLVTALRKPHIRGNWGEVTLRNVVELAGMSAHCDFTEQLSLETDGGRLRPDMVIHLPGGHDIVVDSKVSLEALLDAVSAQTEDAKKDALKRHSKHVEEQVKRLSSKAYWSQFEKSPEFAVLFTSESSLYYALEVAPSLIEESFTKKVMIATPTTLISLLSAFAYGWRQEAITRNAVEIARLGKELYEKVTVWARHINEIGVSLGKSIEAYNRAVGSMEARIVPSVRKFKELGVTAQEEIPELKKVEQMSRNLNLME